MLQQMRDQTQGFGFKFIVGLLIFVLAIFGFGGFNLFAPGTEIASVNGVEISRQELEREAQLEMRRIAAQFGENFDPSLINAEQLQGSVLNRLVSQQLLLQEAQDLGLGVSQEQAEQAIVDDPNFALDGKFDEGTYRRLVRNINQTPQGYVEATRQNLLLQQFNRAISSSAVLPEWQVRQLATVIGQTRDIGYLTFSPDKFADQVTVAEQDIEIAYEDNLADHMTPLTLDVAYVQLSWEQLTKDADGEPLVISDDEVVSAYEAELAAAVSSEQRASSHILLQVNAERDEAAALAQITTVAQRLADGEDFAELAESVSEDPGSKGEGGKLGLVGKGVFDPAFESALWALSEPGQISQPVQSSFGYHVIRLDSIQENTPPTLAERRSALEAELREQQARALFGEKLREIDKLAYEQPESLDGVAEEFGLTIERQLGVGRLAATGPFANAQVRESLFSEDVLEKGYNTPALDLSEEAALVARVEARNDPKQRPLAEVRSAIELDLRQKQAADAAASAFKAALIRIEAGESVVDVARDYELDWQTVAAAQRSTAKLSRPVAEAAFALAPPTATAKSVGSAALPTGGNAIVTVTAVRDGDYAAMTEREREDLERYLTDRAARLDFVGLYANFEEGATIKKPALAAPAT